jgi:hypothetical protein
MKKTFIKVNSGLIDPEHTNRMGSCIWLYLYMLYLADWRTGTVHAWTDQSASDELGMPKPTVRYQRNHLEQEGYIICKKGQHSISIEITKWVHPKNGASIPPQSDNELSPQNAQSDNQSDNQSDKSIAGLPSTSDYRLQKEKDTLTKMMDHIDEYPPELQGVVQDICEVWGHRPPTKKSQYFSMWIRGTRELLEACGEFPVKDVVASIRERWEADGGGISITSPMSLVSLARDDAARRRSGPLNVKAHGQKDLARQPMTDKEWQRKLMDGTLEISDG